MDSNKKYVVHVKVVVYDENGTVVHNTTQGTSSMNATTLENFLQRQQNATTKVIRETY